MKHLRLRNKFLILALLLACNLLYAKNVVNVYLWGGEIPKKVIQQFEKDTGIIVNFSTFDSNETMYAKLRASSNTIYDVILPSAYFIERMQKQGMLEPLNHQQLSNIINLDQHFLNNDYDKSNQYSVPIIWGTTGIFYDKSTVFNPPAKWSQLWSKQWRNRLMILDDSREVFAMALLSLGFNPNDGNPEHIKTAYNHLLQLVPNIKLFASESIQAIIIDGDASIGQAWNGDALKAHVENSNIGFIYPEDGYIIWVDCLAIPKHPPHPKEALIFINYLLKPEVSAQIALIEGHAITNVRGRALLPESIQNNPMVYPSAAVLTRGHFQRDVGEETLALYNQYWQQLKLAF